MVGLIIYAGFQFQIMVLTVNVIHGRGSGTKYIASYCQILYEYGNTALAINMMAQKVLYPL